MKTLVIGGTLFIGRRLVDRLLEAGHSVAVLHRRPGHDLGQEVEEVVADRNDPEQVARVVRGRGFDVVFDNVYDWDRGTTSAQVYGAALALQNRLERYIFMSSVAVYGSGLDHKENDELVPDDDANPYSRNKAMSERILSELYDRTGFPVVALRPPFVYGPGNPFYREAFFWDRIRDGRPIILPADGSRLMQFVYVDDLVSACVAAMENSDAPGQAFNVGHDKAISQREAVEALARAAGKQVRMVPIPRERILAAGGNPMGSPAYFGEYLDVPPITEDMTKAKKVLGFRETPFEKALEQTYRWYLENWPKVTIDYSFEDQLLK
ncbi:MAG: SDR family oxidoreductase [Bryobacteraceae bacterium]